MFPASLPASVDGTVHAAILATDRIRLDVLGKRLVEGPPGADVEATLVQRAFNLVAFKEAVAHPRSTVCALRGGGIDGAMEDAGVVFIAENGDGPGVRLRKGR
jgi:hypothetical protein